MFEGFSSLSKCNGEINSHAFGEVQWNRKFQRHQSLRLGIFYIYCAALFFCLTILSSSSKAAVGRFDYYSQSVYQSHTQNFVTQQRLRYQFQPDSALRPYLGAQFEMDAKTEANAIYNDNFVAPTAGITWLPFSAINLGIYSELQFVQRLGDIVESRKQNEIDWRNGLYHYSYNDYLVHPIAKGFIETYGDAYFIRKAERNIIANFWAKSGFRVFNNLPQIDVFLEGIAKRNRKNFPWEKLTALRWGLRGRFDVWGISASGIIDRTLLFAGEDSQRIPWRGQLVLSSLF